MRQRTHHTQAAFSNVRPNCVPLEHYCPDVDSHSVDQRNIENDKNNINSDRMGVCGECFRQHAA
jgi:hypothetical protein